MTGVLAGHPVDRGASREASSFSAAPAASCRSARPPRPPSGAGRGPPGLDGHPIGGGRQRARGSGADGARRARTEWPGACGRHRHEPASRDRRSQRALDWALAIERSRPNPRVTTTRVSTRDHGALLHRVAELAGRARVRYAVTGVVGAYPLSTASSAPPRTLQIRVRPVTRARSRAVSARNEQTTPTVNARRRSSSGPIPATWEPAMLVTCAASRSPTRSACGWTSPATDDRYAEVAQRFRECAIDRPRPRVP